MNARKEQLTVVPMPKEFIRLLELLKEMDQLKKSQSNSASTFKQAISELEETIKRVRAELESGQASMFGEEK